MAQHVLLNLHRLDHPHNGESTTGCIDLTLETSGINEDKALLVITDNSSNIVKAIRLLRDQEGQVEGPQEQPDGMDMGAKDTDTESSDTEAEESSFGKDIYLLMKPSLSLNRRTNTP